MNRSFGWIEEAGDLFKLRSIAELFVYESSTNNKLRFELIPNLISQSLGRDRYIFELSHEPIAIPYSHLVGRGPQPGETRKNASCSGIVQALIPAQNKRPYVSDWVADSYVRLAVSLGIIDYNKEDDTCFLSDFGEKLLATEKGSENEKFFYGKLLLMYPPASRVLQLLSDNNGSFLSKYELGQNIGFIGEKGFTSYPEYLIAEALLFADKNEQKRIRQNVEGTCDKYSRMICNWLLKLGWVKKEHFEVLVKNGERVIGSTKLLGFKITLSGSQAFKNASGFSSHARMPKLVKYEMLGTAEPNSSLLRKRRGTIIQILSKSKETLLSLQDKLEGYDIFVDSTIIRDDINGLKNIGLNIAESSDGFKLMDKVIGLVIPDENPVEKNKNNDIVSIKNELRLSLSNVNHKYLSLIDYAYDPSSSLLFELTTIDLLNKELGFNAIHLGYANKPDGILSVGTHGVIIDNKAYSQGFSLPISQRREMKDYLDQNLQRNELINPTKWWEQFPSTNISYSFLFVSSFFCGNYLKSLKKLNEQANSNGALISAKQLLLLSDKIKSASINNEQLVSLLNSNSEIVIE